MIVDAVGEVGIEGDSVVAVGQVSDGKTNIKEGSYSLKLF